MDTRELFKRLAFEAQLEKEEREFATTVLGTHGSQRPDWFKKKGKYVYLTDDYIDSLPENELTDKLILFISDCFKQR
jgi:hypothetical protein